MAPPSTSDKPVRRKSRLWATIKALTRTRVMAGLLVVLPIYITVMLVRFVFEIMRDASQWVVYGILQGAWTAWLPESWGLSWSGFTQQELEGRRVQWTLGVFSVFLTIFLLYAIGLFTANVVGHRLLYLFEWFIGRVPLVKTVYNASKQILATFTGGHSQAFQRVVLVPFPTREVRSIGFLTGTTRDSVSGEELCSVFIPTTPNPTSGFLFFLKPSDVTELEWSVEDAIKVIMSGGILSPDSLALASPARIAETARKTTEDRGRRPAGTEESRIVD
jgi:uncharacterized membrane protein